MELGNERHTCQCPDFRVRKRSCKHIKLVLQQLGLSEDSGGWHKVKFAVAAAFFENTFLHLHTLSFDLIDAMLRGQYCTNPESVACAF